MGGFRRSAVFLAVCALLVAAPGSALAAQPVNPDGEFGTALGRREGHNPSLGSKLIGYTRYVDRAGGAAPDVLIVGSSRAVQLDPQLINEVSGQRAYNAAVSDAAARENLAITEYADLLTAGDLPHLVVMFDLESLDRRTPTKRVRTVLAQERAARTACVNRTRCRAEWSASARAIMRHAARGIRALPSPWSTQRPDGMQVHGNLETLDAQGVDLAPLRSKRIGIRIRSYQPGGGFDRLMPIPEAATRRMIALANAAGDEPTIVVTAMHPDCIVRCGPAGWFQRRRAALAFLASLKRAGYRLRVIDVSNPASFGAGRTGFFDEIHLRPATAARLVRYLQERGAFATLPAKVSTRGASAHAARVSDSATWFERFLALMESAELQTAS